jgi:hypothetical protein
MTRIRFSLSTLFWAILVIALSLGWWHDRRSLQNKCKIDLYHYSQDLNSFRSVLYGLREDENYSKLTRRVQGVVDWAIKETDRRVEEVNK